MAAMVCMLLRRTRMAQSGGYGVTHPTFLARGWRTPISEMCARFPMSIRSFRLVSSRQSRLECNPELQSCASTDGGDGIHLSTTTSTFPAPSISSTLTTTPRVSLDTTRLSARRLWARPNTLRVHARATHKLLLGTSAFTRHFRPGRLTAWRVCMDI